MSTLLYLKMLFVGTGVVGLGVVLYSKTVPTEEEVVAKFSPEVRQKYYQEKAFREASEPDNKLYELVRSNAQSSRPVWMLSDTIEPACVIRERERASWSTAALNKAQMAAQKKMIEERERLRKMEKDEEKSKGKWFQIW
ncbi:uncharacterized protein V1513DRAFT_439313 [Lipomyces chichibuensis]|uniref:uncharacterized protein n=1 Tax=Lipomyces chichibuensis TaxID=1546026 RepID=UPI0033434E2C